MKDDRKTSDPSGAKGPLALLEFVAATVLLLMLASLGWVILAAAKPTWLRLPSLEAEVFVILGLLFAALVLVSVVALRKTRG